IQVCGGSFAIGGRPPKPLPLVTTRRMPKSPSPGSSISAGLCLSASSPTRCQLAPLSRVIQISTLPMPLGPSGATRYSTVRCLVWSTCRPGQDGDAAATFFGRSGTAAGGVGSGPAAFGGLSDPEAGIRSGLAAGCVDPDAGSGAAGAGLGGAVSGMVADI